jgi:beta-galactosidase
MAISRRAFLKSSAFLIGTGAPVPTILSASIARAESLASGAAASTQLLESGWEFNRESFGGPWEIWNLPTAGWSPVRLPHCFNEYDACDPDTPAYRGQGWYRTSIKPANPFPGGRTLLHFGGAGQRTTVYAGGALMGANAGGYNEFVVDITQAPQSADGAIKLAICCDNSRDPNTIPSDASDFNLYGGIYRHLRLVHVPAVSVELVQIATTVAHAKPADCFIRVRLYNPEQKTGPLDFTMSVLDPDGAIVGAAEFRLDAWSGVRTIHDFTLPFPRLWSPTSPSLYQCRLQIKTPWGEQKTIRSFGLRYFDFQEHGAFFLNGERLSLRGTHRHEDHAGVAAAVPDDVTRREMTMIRAMGANFIRLAHYPQAELVLDLCDELGLIVWEELPWCRAGVGDAAMRENARRLLTLMIEQHYNHPSIAFWSVGNEEDWPKMDPGDGKVTVPEFAQELNDLAHALDPSRYTSLRRCATATGITDVYSPSIWVGWYGGRYQDYQKTLEGYRGKIGRMLHMEWGADCHARRHAEEPYGEPYEPYIDSPDDEENVVDLPLVKHGDWSETYACDLYDWYLKTQETLPWFAGSAQWIFKDFSTPERTENPIPRVNQKGLVERDLTLKEGYFVFQSYWASEPMVHIYGHKWPDRWGRQGQHRLVRVYSNCDSVELFLNGKSWGVRRRNTQDFPCAGLRWEVVFAEGHNQLRAVAHANGKEVVDQIKFVYQTEIWGSPAKLVLKEAGRSASTITVEVKLQDAQGILCLDARNRVRFTLAGDGQLLDNLGTSTGSRVIELYNGRAEISLTHGTQPCVVSVSSQGVEEAFVTIR